MIIENAVTVIIPKDRTNLSRRYNELLTDALADQLSHEELGFLIQELKKKNSKTKQAQQIIKAE